MQAAEETKDTVVSSIAPNLTRNWGGARGERDAPGRNRVANAPGPPLFCSVV